MNTTLNHPHARRMRPVENPKPQKKKKSSTQYAPLPNVTMSLFAFLSFHFLSPPFTRGEAIAALLPVAAVRAAALCGAFLFSFRLAAMYNDEPLVFCLSHPLHFANVFYKKKCGTPLRVSVHPSHPAYARIPQGCVSLFISRSWWCSPCHCSRCRPPHRRRPCCCCCCCCHWQYCSRPRSPRPDFPRPRSSTSGRSRRAP